MESVPPEAVIPKSPSLSSEGTAEASTSPRIYRAGTLRYTLRGLLILFLWLLGGDFAFTFFESIFARYIPIYLKDLQASNTLIGVMTGSFAGLVNVFFLPNISRWSDAYRGRLGRRIPFLYVVAPLTVLSLLAVGFAPELGAWLHLRLIARVSPSIAGSAVVMALLCAFVVSFHFFNMVLVNAYNWLLRDVVPLELMARFLSWFRIVGTASTFLFLWFVFPHISSHRHEVFLAVGLFYLVAFLFMCRNVREGDYPELPPKETRPGLLQSYVIYFRECLTLPLYRNFFIASVLSVVATSCAGPFVILFTRSTLGLDMETLGKILAWGTAASALVYFLMGWLCDRFSPLHVMIGALVGHILTAGIAFFFVDGKGGVLAYNLLHTVPAVAWGLATMAAGMRLFPREKYGQFSSGLNVFGCGALIFGNYLIGKFMDLVHSDYRMTFLWSALLYLLAIYPLLLVCRDWNKHEPV
ncbi:MAG TPA: MFS transporter [Candidatus Methylacidiphilales bacterium]